MRDGARATKFGPDFVRVAVVLRIGVIEVGRPIGDGSVPAELEDKARLALANCPEFAITISE